MQPKIIEHSSDATSSRTVDFHESVIALDASPSLTWLQGLNVNGAQHQGDVDLGEPVGAKKAYTKEQSIIKQINT